MPPSGSFCLMVKRERLVLLAKGKGPPSPHRLSGHSACLTMRESILRRCFGPDSGPGLLAGGLAEREYEFWEGHSTIGAISDIIQMTQKVWKGDCRKCDSCVLVILDVRNTFNSARWADILDALEHRFRVPANFLRWSVTTNVTGNFYIRRQRDNKAGRSLLEWPKGQHLVRISGAWCMTVPSGSISRSGINW